MIYLYGIMDPGAPDPGASLSRVHGVTGAVHVRSLSAGHLIFGEHEGEQILAKRRSLLAHARVLEAASAEATVLPMRFGLLSKDLDEATGLIADQEAAISAQFDRLAGLVEFGLRVTFPERAAIPHTLSKHHALAVERDRLASGSSRMQKAEFGRTLGEALERERTDAQRMLLADLKSVVVDHVLRPPETEFQVLNAHILLRQQDEAAFPERLAELAAKLDFAPAAEPVVSLVGPAPLYNFVRLTLSPSSREAA